MTDCRTIVVTGATGKLGRVVCRALLDRSYRVRATDRRFAKDFPTRITVGDLRDEAFAYQLMEDADTVVHLGNHPNQFAGPSPQSLLSENTAMNANVFQAARDLRVRSIVFASSVQVMIRRDHDRPPPPYPIPYLPIDGHAPPNPGSNSYALSKEFAERMLRLAVELDPALSATAIRFPMLVTEWWAARTRSMSRVPASALDFAECTAHLFLSDAATLVADVVGHSLAGYHQYFPAQTMELRGYPLPEIIGDRYADVPLRKPIAQLTSLIDISEITDALGWEPRERLSVEVERLSVEG